MMIADVVEHWGLWPRVADDNDNDGKGDDDRDGQDDQDDDDGGRALATEDCDPG